MSLDSDLVLRALAHAGVSSCAIMVQQGIVHLSEETQVGGDTNLALPFHSQLQELSKPDVIIGAPTTQPPRPI